MELVRRLCFCGDFHEHAEACQLVITEANVLSCRLNHVRRVMAWLLATAGPATITLVQRALGRMRAMLGRAAVMCCLAARYVSSKAFVCWGPGRPLLSK